jgi:hypothetical protein
MCIVLFSIYLCINGKLSNKIKVPGEKPFYSNMNFLILMILPTKSTSDLSPSLVFYIEIKQLYLKDLFPLILLYKSISGISTSLIYPKCCSYHLKIVLKKFVWLSFSPLSLSAPRFHLIPFVFSFLNF